MSHVIGLAGGITIGARAPPTPRALVSSPRAAARLAASDVPIPIGLSGSRGVGVKCLRVRDVARPTRLRPRKVVSAIATNGASGGSEGPTPSSPEPALASPGAKKKRPFIPALDSTRFFLISYIAVGHFIACCTKDAFTLRLLSQVNVVVGAFFVLSGYVVAYTCTELGKYEASPRVSPAPAFVASRVMGYYPLYIAAQAAFAWVFVYADNLYNGPVATAWHALITCTLTQAWFPAHAELWNAPTWFLSALTFATAALPFALPPIARWRARGLRVAMLFLTLTSLMMKLAYSYDCGAWFFMEGTMGAKTHPNWMFWNQTRFSPFAALVDVLIGCVACRMVTVRECDPAEDPDRESERKRGPGVLLGGEPGTAAASPAIPLLGMLLVIAARAFGWLPLNDALTRSAFFVPLFTAFVMRVHAQTAYADVPAEERGDANYTSFSKALGAKPLTYLGAISFPIYILHGPIGQIFYKRAVASKLFNGTVFTKYPEFFPVYLGIVLVAAALTHEGFMKNKKIQTWFQEKGQAIAKAF